MKDLTRIFGLMAIVSLILNSCDNNSSQTLSFDKNSEKLKIDANINLWHKAAAEADFDSYFNLMTKDAVFIGTDATENWQNTAFRNFSKPYFDKGKAWNFTSLERNIYVSKSPNIAWFDELLDTQMGLCRGSGIMKIENDQWKIAHYVLSICIPNDQVEPVIKLKKEFDSVLTAKLKLKPYNTVSYK